MIITHGIISWIHGYRQARTGGDYIRRRDYTSVHPALREEPISRPSGTLLADLGIERTAGGNWYASAARTGRGSLLALEPGGWPQFWTESPDRIWSTCAGSMASVGETSRIARLDLTGGGLTWQAHAHRYVILPGHYGTLPGAAGVDATGATL